MLDAKRFLDNLTEQGFDFYAGVPDSLLKPLLACIQDHIPSAQHTICANEGNALALTAGYHLGSGRVGVVYMQNSGLGNAVNPLTSLTNPEVYAIPALLLIGWRGEPNREDEPQHRKQGEITPAMLQLLGIDYAILSDDEQEAEHQISAMRARIEQQSKPCALLVRANTFDGYTAQSNPKPLSLFTRELAIQEIISHASTIEGSAVLSTTGKISREVFEARSASNENKNGQERCVDFLNVGSMGHISSIALGVALSRPSQQVFCLDGDGALLMHMGSLAIIGASRARNLLHIVLNNGAHESVGGQPTVADQLDIQALARASGYAASWQASNLKQLQDCLIKISKQEGPLLLEIKVALSSRSNLGRPTTTPLENKHTFMERLRA
ncbi:MAG: phosphonopyruvate decarboxylase [Agarilytica sp.]